MVKDGQIKEVYAILSKDGQWFRRTANSGGRSWVQDFEAASIYASKATARRIASDFLDWRNPQNCPDVVALHIEHTSVSDETDRIAKAAKKMKDKWEGKRAASRKKFQRMLDSGEYDHCKQYLIDVIAKIDRGDPDARIY